MDDIVHRDGNLEALICVECGAASPHGIGWHAEIATDDEGVDEPEVPVYCHARWELEFGA